MNNFLKQKKRCIQQNTKVKNCETIVSPLYNMKNECQTQNKENQVRIETLFRHALE